MDDLRVRMFMYLVGSHGPTTCNIGNQPTYSRYNDTLINCGRHLRPFRSVGSESDHYYIIFDVSNGAASTHVKPIAARGWFFKKMNVEAFQKHFTSFPHEVPLPLDPNIESIAEAPNNILI